ncbi:MAG: FAD binding domain-containing protein [Tepidisphaeraceae bacterium]
MRDHIQLFINGQPVRVDGADCFLTLSDFLRKRKCLTGTKIVCAEGDCGACAVLVGRPRGNTITYAPVTSCIQLMAQLDATHVVTVEGLSKPNELSSIQRAMVECHGTQCGFCTPGFVVTMHHHLTTCEQSDDASLRRALVGNLCRCTGYDAIARAGSRLDRSNLPSVDAIYSNVPARTSLATLQQDDVDISSNHRRFARPATLPQALEFRADRPGAVILNGSTDYGVLVNKRLREPTDLLCLSGLPELTSITVDDRSIRVGATATLSHLEQVCNERLPALGEYLQWFGSPLIKNAGTLAGNLATASPIGDMTPPLMVLNAEVELASKKATRRVPIEQFIVGYRRTVMQPDELITAIHIPIPSTTGIVRFYKVSKRQDLDISTVSASFAMQINGGRIASAHVAMGGVGPTALRLTKTEAELVGKSASIDTFERAGDVARSEVTPITDVRGTEAYRRAVAGNLVVRLGHEIVGGAR